jgi:hypothetical protein
MYFVRPLEYLIKKIPVPTKRATIILIKVKLCNASGVYLQLSKSSSELCDPDTLYYVSKNVRIRGYFSKPKGVCEQKRLGTTALYSSSFPCCSCQKDQGAQAGQLPKAVRCFGNREALDSIVRSHLFNNIRLP